MSFTEAVRACLTQYVTFSGRARRAEYWWFVLFGVLVALVAAIIDSAANITLFQVIVGLALLLPNLAVTFRRLHDTNRTGWWILISLVPVVGGIVLLVFMLIDSDPNPNRFGPCPKVVGPAPAPGPAQA